jgi:predicted dehydrogenase
VRVSAVATRPGLGFLGVGWIGRQRMEAIARSGIADVVAVGDPAVDGALSSLDEVLAVGVDGLVIATPSALHADQAIAALQNGVPVFCQKPLALDAAAAQRVVEAARSADVLLGVDFSYRFTEAARRLHDVVTSGALGEIFAVDLVFHNAYGPDKAWFSDPALSGGGCVIDLGIHLVDLALWLLGAPEVERVTSSLRGAPLEDHAEAQIVLAGGTVVRLACSWRLHAGRDCVLEASFYGTQGGASLRNLGGSFYDFVAERYDGTRTETLAVPPDDWGGRGAVEWATRLAAGERFDAAVEDVVRVHEIVDQVYREHA